MYRTFQTDTWGDPWFIDLPPERKLLFIHLFTNRNVTACGSMQLSVSQIAFETKLSPRKVEQGLRDLGAKVLWLPEHNLIIVRNFYRHQRSKSSENFTVAARKAMTALPGEARAWLGDVYPELADTHGEGIPNPSPTQGDKETVTVTVAVTEPVAGDIPPPPLKGEPKPKTPQTIKTPVPESLWDDLPAGSHTAMCEEQGMTIGDLARETEKMADHYRSKGEKRADWVATWRNWMRSDFRKPRGHPAPRNGKPERPTQNGRTGYTIDELKRLANGESLEPARDDQAAYDPVFRVVQ